MVAWWFNMHMLGLRHSQLDSTVDPCACHSPSHSSTILCHCLLSAYKKQHNVYLKKSIADLRHLVFLLASKNLEYVL